MNKPKITLSDLMKKITDEDTSEERDEQQERGGTWENVDLTEETLSKGKVDFVYQCFIENLNHARHVENERLTFNSIYFALAVGVMAFTPQDKSDKPLWGFMCIGVFLAGIISITLTRRWNNSFDRHYTYAKRCYKLLWDLYFPDSKMSEDSLEQCKKDKEFLAEINNFPLYCFKIRNPEYGVIVVREHTLSTKGLYLLFCYIIQIAILRAAIYSFGDIDCITYLIIGIPVLLFYIGYLIRYHKKICLRRWLHWR